MYKPPVDEAMEGDVMLFGHVHFTQEETARFHAACRAHGRTVTQVFYALLNLANVETSLRAAGNAGLEQYQAVLSAFEISTHLFSSMNFANMASTCISRN